MRSTPGIGLPKGPLVVPARDDDDGMSKHVALFRGINVGKAKRISMSDLKAVFEGLGYADVTTVLQSGNVIFEASAKDARGAAARIERALTERVGISARVLVRNNEQLRKAVTSNPMREAEADPKAFHLAFLEAKPSESAVKSLDPAAYAPDEFAFGDGVLYVWYRGGVRNSKLALVLDKKLGVATTARNWNTVLKLLAVMS